MTEKKKTALLSQVLIAVIVALAAGGSAPWWLDKIFLKSDNTPNVADNGLKTDSIAIVASDFSEGSKRVYFANFKDWPTKTSEHGSITLTSTNSYVLQPSSNIWIGPGRYIDIPAINGDYVFDIWVAFHHKLPSALKIIMSGSGTEADLINLYLSVWDKNKVTFSITKDLVRSGNGLPIGYVVRSEKIASREQLPNTLKNHKWTKNSKLTIKREGGNLYFFVNDKLVKKFFASVFTVDKIDIGAAFESKVVLTSIEGRIRK